MNTPLEIGRHHKRQNLAENLMRSLKTCCSLQGRSGSKFHEVIIMYVVQVIFWHHIDLCHGFLSPNLRHDLATPPQFHVHESLFQLYGHQLAVCCNLTQQFYPIEINPSKHQSMSSLPLKPRMSGLLDYTVELFMVFRARNSQRLCKPI